MDAVNVKPAATLVAAAKTTMDYIRKQYGVHAKRGGRVEFSGGGVSRQGVILGSKGPYLRVRFDGESRVNLLHPTWELRYLSDEKVKAAA